ncbi:MAG: hypothetical protein WAV20_23650, partial [Blastocatellia bacterium]
MRDSTLEIVRFAGKLFQRFQTRSLQIRLALSVGAAGVFLIHSFLFASAGPSNSTAMPGQDNAEPSTLSEQVGVLAAGRGNPLVNLSGRDVLSAYRGPTEVELAIQANRARPLSLCSADFDEDGIPDLISGYAGPDGGIVTLHRGNVDCIYPTGNEA